MAVSGQAAPRHQIYTGTVGLAKSVRLLDAKADVAA
jgi:hypothetical protein